MDSDTNISQLKEKIKKFCEDRDWDQYHNAKDLAIGIITESSELLEKFRFKSPNEVDLMLKNKEKRQEISEEMVDVFYFLLRFAQKYDVDLSNELSKKISKNEKKYSIEKSKGSNKKYNEL